MAIDAGPSIADDAASILAALNDLAAVFPVNRFFRFILVGPEYDSPPDPSVLGPLGLDKICSGDNLPHSRRVDLYPSRPMQDPQGVTLSELENNALGTRLTSQKHLIVVTDQDLSTTASVTESATRELGPGWAHAPVHGLSDGGGGGGSCRPSRDLANLAGRTHGIHTSLCPLGASPLWQAISTPLAACSFDVTGIDQAEFDNVTLFTSGSKTPLQLVDELADCGSGDSESMLAESGGDLRLVLCLDACAAYQFASLQRLGGLRLSVCG